MHQILKVKLNQQTSYAYRGGNPSLQQLYENTLHK